MNSGRMRVAVQKGPAANCSFLLFSGVLVDFPWGKALVSVVTIGAVGAGSVLLSGCGSKSTPTASTSSTSAATSAATVGAGAVGAPSPTGNGGNVGATDGSSANAADASTT